MNRNDYHLLETPKDFTDFWSHWELEDVPHGDFQKGDILVQVWEHKTKGKLPRKGMVFMEAPRPDALLCADLDDLRVRQQTPPHCDAERYGNWTYKRVKESALFFKENITDRVANDESFPVETGDLIDVRVGNAKWSLALFLGLDKDWLEKGDGPTYSIHLCNKTKREALGAQFDTCSHRGPVIDWETNIIRVIGHDYWKQRKWFSADLWNAKDECFVVRWRKK